MGILPDIHKQINSKDLFWWEIWRVTIMPVSKRVIFILKISRRKDHFSCCKCFLITTLSFSLHFYVIVNIHYHTQILNLHNIRLLLCVFMFNIFIQNFNNVCVLKRAKLLIIDKLEAFNIFMCLYICHYFLRTYQVIRYKLFPQNYLLFADCLRSKYFYIFYTFDKYRRSWWICLL